MEKNDNILFEEVINIETEEQTKESYATIEYETKSIKIPFDLSGIKERFLFLTIKKLGNELSQLKERIKFLELYIPKEISDWQARLELVAYLKSKKNGGSKIVDILELSAELNIPADQVERVIEKLEEEGAVKINGKDN